MTKRAPLLTTIATTLLIVCANVAPSSAAENYPSRLITMIVPWPAGGATDANARMLAQEMSKEFKQPIVIENKSGAGGNIGAALAARAPADGYTLVYIASSNVITSLSIPSPSYGQDGDLMPVALTVSEPLLLLVSPNIHAADVQGLVAELKQLPSVTYASTGAAGLLHIAGAAFLAKAGLKGTQVPYRGTAPALTDLLGNQVQMFFGTFSDAYPLVQAKTLRALAITSGARSALLPDVPTLSEALGHADSERGTWQGVLAPKGTPPDVVETLARSINTALNDPVIHGTILSKGLGPLGGGPAEFEARIKKERDDRKAAMSELGIDPLKRE